MRPIDPGSFRNVVTHQQATETPSSVGQSLKSWVDVGPVWCSIEPLSARETWLAQQVQATTTHKITCRYNPAIQPTGRLKHPDGRIFNIEGVMDLEDRHVHMVLTCTQKAS